MDHQQSREEARTCASLVERVVARSLDRRLTILPGEDGPKGEGVGPALLVRDPEAFYAALERALEAMDVGPDDDRVAVSPASRLVGRCQTVTRP